MRSFGVFLEGLSLFISLLFGIGYFIDITSLFLAIVLYLIGHYLKHNFSYRHFSVSQRSKPFLQSFLRKTFHAVAYVILFVFLGYLLPKLINTDFYITHLQNLTQSTGEIIDEIISFWMNIPYRLMRYEH